MSRDDASTTPRTFIVSGSRAKQKLTSQLPTIQSQSNALHVPRTTAGIATAPAPRNNTFIKADCEEGVKGALLGSLYKREMRLKKNSSSCKRNPNPGRPLGRCRGRASAHFCNRFS